MIPPVRSREPVKTNDKPARFGHAVGHLPKFPLLPVGGKSRLTEQPAKLAGDITNAAADAIAAHRVFDLAGDGSWQSVFGKFDDGVYG
jgi:hypothetical protein